MGVLVVVLWWIAAAWVAAAVVVNMATRPSPVSRVVATLMCGLVLFSLIAARSGVR